MSRSLCEMVQGLAETAIKDIIREDTLTDLASKRLFMSRKFGGLGLAGADSLPLAAFLASWAHVALAKEQGKLPAAIQTSIQDVLTGKRQGHFFHTLDGVLSKATEFLDDLVVQRNGFGIFLIGCDGSVKLG